MVNKMANSMFKLNINPNLVVHIARLYFQP